MQKSANEFLVPLSKQELGYATLFIYSFNYLFTFGYVYVLFSNVHRLQLCVFKCIIYEYVTMRVMIFKCKFWFYVPDCMCNVKVRISVYMYPRFTLSLFVRMSVTLIRNTVKKQAHQLLNTVYSPIKREDDYQKKIILSPLLQRR